MAWWEQIGRALSNFFEGKTSADRRAIKELERRVGAAQTKRIERELRKATRTATPKPTPKPQAVTVEVSGDEALYERMFMAHISSNVWAYWLKRPEPDQRNGTLIVQYRGKNDLGEPANVAGPMYGYRDVSLKLFKQMVDAASKGTFVWDHLRVRGTVFDHQKDYFFINTPGSYVPRKATSKGFNPRSGSTLPGTGDWAGRTGQ